MLIIDINVKEQRTKDYLINEGLKLIEDFLILNNILMPEIIISNENSSYNGCYFSNKQKIVLYRKNVTVPAIKPGYKWSYPGYKADLTPCGILTHELGHYLDDLRGKSLHKEWVIDIKGEKCVTRYDNKNTVNEQIAEAIKLFLTNPNLLKVGRPKRYNFLVNKMNLIPLHDVDWQIILQYAHPKYISATQNWIK